MRAKEYLEHRKEDIFHFELVKKIIHELYPLRANRTMTEEYFNRYLFADARYRADKNRVPWEGEIGRDIALEVRNEVRHVVAGDDTFIFAYNIIAGGRNKFCNHVTLEVCALKDEDTRTVNKIKETCKKYKEDYPKTRLSDYLLDHHNKEFYTNKRLEVHKERAWWLNAFNLAYELFDKARVYLDDTAKASSLVTGLSLEDIELKNTVMGIVCCLLEHYDFGLSEDERKKIHMIREQVHEVYTRSGPVRCPRKEIEELKATLDLKVQEIAALKEANEALERQLAENKRAAEKGGLTVSGFSLAIYYIFDALGVNFSNSDKTQWARFIHGMTGRSYQNIRRSLYFNFDDKSTRKNLRQVASLFSELFPVIEQKILNDMQET